MSVMTAASTTPVPTLLFGAFDRHNFGDLLFPHIVAAMLPRDQLLFTGLVERDLSEYGGHRVDGLTQAIAKWGECPLNIFHVGGELLTCDAWQAALMLTPLDRVRDVVDRFDANLQQRMAWANEMLGVPALAPYVLSRDLFPAARRIIYNAVGGVELGTSDVKLRAEVLGKLKVADAVGVRDGHTLAQLKTAGITAQLMPDPAVMVAELFGQRIYDCSNAGEVSQLLTEFSQGYIAVQFSADFGDDETLLQIARQLDQAAVANGYGVVFFRAGAAPWHDDLECYRRTASRMQISRVKIFTSLNVWKICSVIAHSRLYCGSSLHGRIVAMAFALPRLNLRHSTQRGITKQAAFAATWDEGVPAVVDVPELAHGIAEALAADTVQLQHRARALVARYRSDFYALCEGIQ